MDARFSLSVLVAVIFGAIVYSVIMLANQDPIVRDNRPTYAEVCAKRIYIPCVEDMAEEERKVWTPQ